MIRIFCVIPIAFLSFLDGCGDDDKTSASFAVSWPCTQSANAVSCSATASGIDADAVVTYTWSPEGLNVETDTSTGQVNQSFDWSTWCATRSQTDVTLRLQALGDGQTWGPQGKTFTVCT
ncbi:MAG: hypothetical protein AAGE94_08305 [Acidobacteriota bacterium]